MILLTMFNTTSFSSKIIEGKDIYKFEIHTNVDLKQDDTFSVNGKTPTKILKIKDLLTDDDRHHGDILNKHYYIIEGVPL